MTRKYWATFLRSAVLLCTPLICSATITALIVDDSTDSFDVTVATNLQGYLTTAGYSVTISSGVPGGSIASYNQVWDVRYANTDPLSGSDITAYLTYLAGGGSLFVMGENTGFVTRDNSIVSLITSAGGGSVTLSGTNSLNLQTVNSPFTGPNSLTTVTFRAIGGWATTGSGTVISAGTNGLPGSLVFSPGSLTNATAGSLISVLDVNFLDSSASTGEINFAKNLIAYLAAPTSLPPTQSPTPTVPALSTWAMIVLAAGLILLGFGRLRAWKTA